MAIKPPRTHILENNCKVSTFDVLVAVIKSPNFLAMATRLSEFHLSGFSELLGHFRLVKLACWHTSHPGRLGSCERQRSDGGGDFSPRSKESVFSVSSGPSASGAGLAASSDSAHAKIQARRSGTRPSSSSWCDTPSGIAITGKVLVGLPRKSKSTQRQNRRAIREDERPKLGSGSKRVEVNGRLGRRSAVAGDQRNRAVEREDTF